MTTPEKHILRCALCLSWFFHATLYAEEMTATEYNGPKENLHVYLLIGQSNMAGRAPFSDQEAKAIPGCYLLNENNAFEPAKNPLNRYSSIRKQLGMQKMNPGYTFSEEMLKKGAGNSIGLVVNAKGGTKIEQWMKGSHFYEEVLRRTRVARKRGTLKGILWHQGEGNSRNPDAYLGHLKDLILNLRQDLHDPNLFFVAGQIFYHPEKKPHTKEINEEIAKLPATVPFTGYVKSEGLTTYDGTHFDTRGMKILGKRYADEILKIELEQKAEQ